MSREPGPVQFLKQLKLDTASKVKVLLTSRRDEQKWLGGIPHRIAMPRMRNSDAAKLALKLGEERNLTRAEIADWQPLLDYCAGNPLTLRVLVGQAVRMGPRGKVPIGSFVEAIRSGEQAIQDTDATQGRDKSLGASLDYGFRHAFKDDELPIIALLHLFQGTVDVDALRLMGEVGEYALPELQGKNNEHLTGLLERARDTGLLTHVDATWFTIHPALPWFLRQLFAHHYDGQGGRSSAQTALRAWVEAVGELGSYYQQQFIAGNRGVVDLLELEETNLVHARRLARRNQWWHRVVSCMQGLRNLYDYHGRTAEWARLVEEIRPDFCTPYNEPIPGREDEYNLVMEYRVGLATPYERDLAKATALQGKLVESTRQLAAAALALPGDAPLDGVQRNRLRTLAASLDALGQILREARNGECVEYFQEAIRILRRIRDKAAEAIAEFNLGHAYKDLPAIRDLEEAEAAYQRSLDLNAANDALNRCASINQIGMVHHMRFRDARKRDEPPETLMRHLQAAQKLYLQALQLCPKDALTHLAPINNQLGNLYSDVDQLDDARGYFEQAAQNHDRSGNHFAAGETRLNIAIMYARATARETQRPQQRANFQRARAYAEAALRDFQRYQGRAATHEAEAQRLLDHIRRAREAAAVRSWTADTHMHLAALRTDRQRIRQRVLQEFVTLAIYQIWTEVLSFNPMEPENTPCTRSLMSVST